jgi:hypothetical protein
MKYFTKEFPKADNNPSLRKSLRDAIDNKFLENCKAYRKQLSKLAGRISQAAWNFFYFGFGGWGLHDAHLLSFAAGDGLDHPADGSHQFNCNTQKAKVRLLIPNHDQNLLYSFTCSDIRKTVFDYPTDDPLWNWGRLDFVLTYELTAVNKRYLRLEFLFSSGATILVEFARLKFKRKRLPTR